MLSEPEVIGNGPEDNGNGKPQLMAIADLGLFLGYFLKVGCRSLPTTLAMLSGIAINSDAKLGCCHYL